MAAAGPRGRALGRVLAFTLFLSLSTGAGAGTLRDIYSTEPGNTGFSLAAVDDCENGCQGVPASTTTYHSAPYGLRLKFTAGETRDIVGVRFINPDWTDAVYAIPSPVKYSGALEFWVNPKASPNVPSFSVGLVCDVNGTQVETRVPLSTYLPSPHADAWTYVHIPFAAFSDTGFSYDPATDTTTPQAFDWSRVRGLNFSCDTTASGFYDPSVDDVRFVSDIEPISIDGEEFTKSDGTPTRFWGVNLAACYPTHSEADGLAANMASLEINLVRWHHLMRNSLDWNPNSGIGALVTYSGTTRTPNATAFDRFDYLNAQFRSRGIHVLLSLDFTRRFLPGDVDILTTNSADRTAWMNAMTALNAMPSNLDLVRMLPMIDERAARLMMEFASTLLTHVNPYTGVSYGHDPQVLYVETMNETSSEYGVVAGNQFASTTNPAVSYFHDELQAKWAAYTSANGVAGCDIYSTSMTTAQKLARGDFLRELDRAYFVRVRNYVRNLGCQTPMLFSNLWRGESFQKLQGTLNDVIEDHQYVDPYVVRSLSDICDLTARSSLAGKPYVVGELNQLTDATHLAANAVYRTMLPVATAAYGSLHGWGAAIWFAWEHGDRALGADGWSTMEARTPADPNDMIGEIHSDGMMLDHLRTAGLLFKHAMADPSVNAATLYVDDPTDTTGYTQLITPKYQTKPGWQNVSDVRRAFGTVPGTQASAPWMVASPASPVVSDTGQIHKDVTRQQLTVAAPEAEAFSGKWDGSAPVGPTHLQITGSPGSATAILVANDGQTLSQSQDLYLSRTYLNASGTELTTLGTTLTGMKTPTNGMGWYLRRTRPRPAATTYQLLSTSSGTLALPNDAWHEAELRYAPVGSLP